MLRGRAPWGGGGDDEERAARRLLIAVVLQALRDAQGGDLDAGSWLDDVGPGLALALDVHHTAFAGWRSVSVKRRKVQRAARERQSNAERSKLYRERKRQACSQGR